MGTIISAIIDGVLSAAISWLQGIAEKRQLVKTGQAQQAAAGKPAQAAKAETAMAQAEADAPKTPDAALQRLKDGTA